MERGRPRHSIIPPAAPALLVLLGCVVLLWAGCSYPQPSKQFNELLSRYPPTEDPLQVQLLTAGSAEAVPLSSRGRPVTFIVHPAYSLFFRKATRSFYTEAKFDLLKHQLESEARFITEIGNSGNLLILVLPGNYEQDSVAPAAYTRYLNSAVGGSPAVYAVYSETSSSGALPVEAVVMLHGFLKSLRPPSVLVGGGFIGRCQREFYNQVITYVGEASAFIVPEISTVSPDDISDGEAQTMLEGILRGDYGPIDRFIDKRNKGRVRVTLLPGELDQREEQTDGAPVRPEGDGGPVLGTVPMNEQALVPAGESGREKEPAAH
jgi:hypothetical protein